MRTRNGSTRLAAALALAALALLASVATAPAARAAGDGGVLVVGDSLEELTSPHIAGFLPPGVKLTVNAVGGYNSFQIYDLFEESYDPSQSVIVFDAGTNDNPAYPEILAGNLAKVAATVGDRCLVVPTIHGFTVDGVDNDGKNRVVREFAASRPGTQVPDWASFQAAHPELMADELHPDEEGSVARAELIAQGIVGCLSGASTQLGSPPGAGPTAAASGAPSAPVLDEEPDRIETVEELSSREDSMLRAVGMAVAGQAAVLLARGVLSP